MGIELDVLVGHPEYDLLFVASEVARVSGLKNPSHAVSNYRRGLNRPLGINIGTLLVTCPEMIGSIPPSGNGNARSHTTILIPESDVYQMLLRGHAPQAEPFRKWVTEEVLPTIRKTGKYDAEQSTSPIAMGLMDELKALRGASVREKQGARWVLALLRERRSVAVNLKMS